MDHDEVGASQVQVRVILSHFLHLSHHSLSHLLSHRMIQCRRSLSNHPNCDLAVFPMPTLLSTTTTTKSILLCL